MSRKEKDRPHTPPNRKKLELGLSPSAQFVGYGVFLPSSDEFLAAEEVQDDVIARAWALVPDWALLFSKFRKAKNSASRYGKGAIVIYIFWNTDHYVIEMAN